MSFILSVPMIVKVCVSLALILVVNRFSGSLIAAVLAGTLLLAFWAGHSVGTFSHIAWERLSHRDNLFLLLIIILVIWMSGQMAESGIMNSLVTSFQSRVSNRASMAMLPAVVGLLPMPGGALFSAPLVDDCDPGKSVDPVIKGRINYWFRHIWEYWWPLYAGVLLAAELAGIQLWHMIAAGIPVTLFSILGGWIFLLRRVEKREKSRTGRFDLNALVPVFIVIAIYALLEIFFPAASGISKYFPIAVGIIAAMIYLQIRKPITAGQWKKIILSWKTLSLAVIVAVIRIYGAFMEAPLPDGEFIVNIMRLELEGAGVPVLPLIMIIPFISGFTTGIALGMVGASFPIVMQLAGIDPGIPLLVSTAILAYSAGHVGQLVSPVHVCLVVTNQHFHTSLVKSLKGLWGPCLFVLLGGFAVSRIILLF